MTQPQPTIRVRESDNYVNLDDLIKASGTNMKEFKRFLQLQSTKKLFAELEAQGIEPIKYEDIEDK